MKNIINFLLILNMVFLSACDRSQEKIAVPVTQEERPVYDLNESTDIIIVLIKTDKLPQVLADHDAEGLSLLLKNFSPAEMAFEAEVLNYEQPVLVFFFDTHVNQADKNVFQAVAEAYKEKIKCVAVDAEKLFRIAQQSEVDVLPTYLFINQRKEINRLENSANFEQLTAFLQENLG
ncbi:MAG: thioredoxin family protein [Candidatus Babeliaceae bacterium]